MIDPEFFFRKPELILKKNVFYHLFIRFILNRRIPLLPIIPCISVRSVSNFGINGFDFKHIRRKSNVYDARRIWWHIILFYSYALVEFWVRAFGCDWLTPDTRPWYHSTASCRRTRCCSPRDASHSSSPSSDAAARGSSQDACWSRLVQRDPL